MNSLETLNLDFGKFNDLQLHKVDAKSKVQLR